MKKIKYIIIGSLLIALVLLVSGSMMGGFNELGAVYSDIDFHFPFDDLMDFVEEFNDVNNLKIEADTGNIEIIEYEGTNVKVDAKNVSSKIKLEQTGDTLVIENSIRLLGFGNNASKIQVYVPRDYQFTNIDVDVDAGSIKVANLKSEQVEINVDAGMFEAQSLISTYTKVDVDVGKARIDSLDCPESEFECDAGSIWATMTGSEADYSYSVNCDLGSLKVGGYDCEGISDKYRHQGGNRKIKADCDIGKIIIEMEES